MTLNWLPNLIRNDGWIMKIILVLLGGGFGSVCRYALSLLAVQLFGVKFPWGTLMVNLSGCFLIGLAFALAERGLNIMNPSIRLFFMTGFLGGLDDFFHLCPGDGEFPAGGNASGHGGQFPFQ